MIPDEVLKAEYTPYYYIKFGGDSAPYTRSWLTQWLQKFQGPDADPALAISSFQTIQTDFLYCPDYPCNSIIITGTFDAKPSSPSQSLWTQTISEINAGGWVRIEGFAFLFDHSDEGFKLTDIYLSHPIDFEYTFKANQFDGVPDEQIVSQLMHRWFDVFVSNDVCPDARLGDYTIDDIQPEGNFDGMSAFTVTFSTKWPPEEKILNCQWWWGDRFTGLLGENYKWTHNRLYFVGLKHQDRQLIFKSMRNYRPPFDTLILLNQLPADTPEALADVVMERYMTTDRIGPYITDLWKLLDYRIDQVNIIDLDKPIEVEEDYFGLEIHYSALPYQALTQGMGCPGVACEGEWDRSSGWVSKLYECFIIQRLEGGYDIYNFSEVGCWQLPWARQ